MPTDLPRNDLVSVGTSSVTALQPCVAAGLRRTQMIITNSSAAAVVTIAKGDTAAIANKGIPLQPNGTYVEADDSGFRCWQGPVQVIASAAGGQVSVTESFVAVR